MQVDLQVEVPKGYELTGEYRAPVIGDFYLEASRRASKANINFSSSWLILRKVDTWRDATLDDLERVMDGETVECKYQERLSLKWVEGYVLRGWYIDTYGEKAWVLQAKCGKSFWYSENCQVKE
jgi:endonuclease YncB( thermonuclease family)